MLFAELVPLTQQLHADGWQITIETAGTLFLDVKCDLMSVSPKFASSAPDSNAHPRWHARHQQSRHVPDVIRRLIAQYHHQFKFVLDQPADLRPLNAYLAEFKELDPSRVFLMPQGTTAPELETRRAWIEPYCAEHGFHFCPRRHVEWFGHARGT